MKIWNHTAGPNEIELNYIRACLRARTLFLASIKPAKDILDEQCAPFVTVHESKLENLQQQFEADCETIREQLDSQTKPFNDTYDEMTRPAQVEYNRLLDAARDVRRQEMAAFKDRQSEKTFRSGLYNTVFGVICVFIGIFIGAQIQFSP